MAKTDQFHFPMSCVLWGTQEDHQSNMCCVIHFKNILYLFSCRWTVQMQWSSGSCLNVHLVLCLCGGGVLFSLARSSSSSWSLGDLTVTPWFQQAVKSWVTLDCWDGESLLSNLFILWFPPNIYASHSIWVELNRSLCGFYFENVPASVYLFLYLTSCLTCSF